MRSSIATRRVGQSLISLGRGINECSEASSTIDERLSKIHQIVLEIQEDISSQKPALDHILKPLSPTSPRHVHCSSSSERLQLGWNNRQEPHSSGGQNPASVVEDAPELTTEVRRSEDRNTTALHEKWAFEIRPGSTRIPDPYSYLEGSRNSYPETYTSQQRLAHNCAIIIGSCEKIWLGDRRTNVYSVFVKAGRRWCRIQIAIHMERSSRHWKTARASRGQFMMRPAINVPSDAKVPQHLLQYTQVYLSGADHVSSENVIQALEPRPLEDFGLITCPAVSTYCDAISFLNDLGCRRIFEDEVAPIQLFDPPYRFATIYKDMLVCETRFTDSTTSSELLYAIHALHCLRGVPGFAKLVGYVVDRSGTRLKSYLIEFSIAAWNLRRMGPHQSASWARREKWARQLVEIIAEAHSRGFALGTLMLHTAPLILDTSDSVQ